MYVYFPFVLVVVSIHRFALRSCSSVILNFPAKFSSSRELFIEILPFPAITFPTGMPISGYELSNAIFCAVLRLASIFTVKLILTSNAVSAFAASIAEIAQSVTLFTVFFIQLSILFG